MPFEQPVVISITGHFNEQILALLDEQIALFEQNNPDIKVAVITAPGREAERHDQFVTELGSGDTDRDIYVLNPLWLAEFDASGWLDPLDEYTQLEGLEVGEFLPAAIQANTLAGQLVALPWVADGGVLYYRRDLLAEHGYDPPATWADLQQIALDIKAKEDLPFGFVWQGAPYESLTCNTLESTWAYGGDVLDKNGVPVFDSAQTRAALQQMSDFITLGISPPEVATYEEASTLQAFQNDGAVFMRHWPSAWNRLNSTDSPTADQVGLAPLPTSCLGGQSLALSIHSLHPRQAFRFMAFLVGYEQQLQLARGEVLLPALETVYSDAQLLAEDPSFRDLHAALSVTRPRPQSPAYAEMSEAIYTEVNRMLLGEQDAATTAVNVQHRLEAILHKQEAPNLTENE